MDNIFSILSIWVIGLEKKIVAEEQRSYSKKGGLK
jgi:hypothetical protein